MRFAAIVPAVRLGRIGPTAGAILLAFLGRSAVSSPLPAENPTLMIAGQARAIDGDTIEIGQERIRLEGIDAPETSQTCHTSTGNEWACGEHATAYLRELIDEQDVVCDKTGVDKYRRVLATCYVAGVNINEAMVRAGFAWAFVKYSAEYVAVEAEARVMKVGVWEGTAIAPWDFRHGTWSIAGNAAERDCTIKGNISSHGHIYHMPWSPWYDRVNINSARGERWFCSESEALAAGWRRVSSN
ncbi:succinoglycan biosynthesis protein [Hyphomicrobium methylovorum]|uniref:thermonuclease family protein n=1 Tax=Hyphomicrobium methylovorum TaxID=84 RepID=UPI0015E7583E|nr:thermonuclease family protein [Hyphomicrobium methylovorum]MBA2125725.1 succinoglycan biosynthesis protein [Hyphomicrobium methylovorum]